MARKILLFGHTGKMGTALKRAIGSEAEITGVNTSDLDVADLDAVRDLVGRTRADIVINAVARLGIDDCEKNPTEAFRINALFPAVLAACARKDGAVLVQFSSEAVFSGEKGDFLTEDDAPDPVNAYGYSKYMSELAVRDGAPRHYVFRLPVLFGDSPKRVHLVERMIDRLRGGETTLRMADDIVTSPTFARDAAEAAWRAVAGEAPYGLYHIANSGKASLFELMRETVALLGLEATVERASYRDFPSLGRKNTVTPLRQTRLPELRCWRDALAESCRLA